MNTFHSISDSELVDRFKNGDESAFDLLVDRYAGRAYQIAYGVLSSREDAEEVAQDVFIRIHRSLKGFRGDCEFTTWLYRIAMNLAKNKYRWNKCRGEGVKVSIDAPVLQDDGDATTMDIPDESHAPDRESMADELRKTLEDELPRIPEVYRVPLIMRTMDDASYEQIAEVLKCKIGTVKSRISRARAILKEKLGLS